MGRQRREVGELSLKSVRSHRVGFDDLAHSTPGASTIYSFVFARERDDIGRRLPDVSPLVDKRGRDIAL